ncbi:hypothetical protein PDESU_06255 [Pontiella desulfatans]|uniref:Uncharacterized protein n=1 Tax=Pontiella desulfatans TaxID=2750659 RepID=A0A6C2UE56_PONDE|nr:hypothetical protein [Pontiella desulfatans]VGO17654.1 hypothetical protein PDESU_06255 [Pontiella desulfatans]
MRPRLAAGELAVSSMILVASITCFASGLLLIVAFARYRFTHLWKSTGAAHSDKYKNQHKKRGNKGRKPRR